MKKLIMTTAIATCLALCAAVWPQSNPAEETPTPAVYAPETAVAKLKTEVDATSLAEKEKEVVPPSEAPSEIPTGPTPTPIEPPAAPVAQPTAESEVAQEADYEPASAPTVIDPQPGDMVYVPGFGWIESQGPNQVEYAEDMYENSNKIGSMG